MRFRCFTSAEWRERPASRFCLRVKAVTSFSEGMSGDTGVFSGMSARVAGTAIGSRGCSIGRAIWHMSRVMISSFRISERRLMMRRMRSGSRPVSLAAAPGSRRVSRHIRFVGVAEERYAQAAMLSDVREYLEHLLNREDKSAMQASVECRVPFLDLDVVDFALNLPFRFKVQQRRGQMGYQKAGRTLPAARNHLSQERWDSTFRRASIWTSPTRFLKAASGSRNSALVKSESRKNARMADASFWYGFLMTEIWGRLFLRGRNTG